ncbi:MAG: APC family permease [Planctomycetota bacterium]
MAEGAGDAPVRGPERPDGRGDGQGAGALSAFDLGCVVVGGIVGVGIFFTPGTVARRVDSGGEVMAVWAIGGALAAIGALVFAELSGRVPGHGGIFRYLHAAFGRLPAFLFGWANWLVIQAGALSVVALVCIEHVERAAFGASVCSPGARVALAAIAILGLTGTNLLGLRVGKRVQNALTVVKIAALCLLVVAAGLAAGEPAAAAPAAVAGDRPGSLPVRLAGALLPVLFAIGGWQQGSFVAGAARRPHRDVPFGILGGVAVVIAVYVAINLAYLSLLGFDGASASTAIGADAARAALGGPGERVFAAMVAISAAGIMNTICMAPPYVLLAMAEQGLFPRAFARRSGAGAPVWGVLGQGTWAVVLLLLAHVVGSALADGDAAAGAFRTLDFVCDSVVFVDWTVFTLCGLALWRLRRRDPAAPFRVPGSGALALLFAAGALAVAIGAIASRPVPSAAGAGIVAIGALAYWLFRHRRSGYKGGAP